MPKRAHTPGTATKDGAATPAPLSSPRKKGKRTKPRKRAAKKATRAPTPAAPAAVSSPPDTVTKTPAILNGRQQRFVDEYMVDLNATDAAKRAGYSAKTAHSIGPRLLEHVGVAAAIAAAKDARAERLQLTSDDVLRELAIIGLSDVRDFQVSGEGQLTLRPGARDATWRAVSSVKHRVVEIPQGADKPPIVKREVELKLWDKNTALTNVGRHLNLFPNRHVLTGEGGGPIKTESTAPPAIERIAAKLQGFIDRHESIVATDTTPDAQRAAEA